MFKEIAKIVLLQTIKIGFFWVSMDPINMSEGLFALANLFSFIRICFLMPANQQLGPLQISLGNMISVYMKREKFLYIFFNLLHD